MTTNAPRGFRIIAHAPHNFRLPQRATEYSAGYDFFSPVTINIPPQKIVRIDTRVGAFMPPDEVLLVYPRSSLALRGVALANGVAVIDADFSEAIALILINHSNTSCTIHEGERIAQGIFTKFLVGNDTVNVKRCGGLGSTGF